MEAIAYIFERVDAALGAALIPLAVWLIISGLDDFFVDFLWIASRLSPRTHQPLPQHDLKPLTAIFVPLWHEHAVIRSMVEHNCAAIDYPNYHFFLGAYPNDQPTRAAVLTLERERPNVHLATCPHDGPTSKADCLNWIYQHLQLHEENTGLRFETILIHDAEDLIHPRSVTAINAALESHDTVQVPVLALPTPPGQWTHGIYCDEFAEYQTRDMPVRELMKAFLPSCGVGTGYRREALEKLAAKNGNRIFEPSCLTEDYENGYLLHRLGARQAFLRLEPSAGNLLATREYFPRRLQSAIRQRTRWVTGNVLQSWERHGWGGGWAERYWLWRDRKGVLGSPLTAFTNLLSLYAGLRYLSGQPALVERFHDESLLAATAVTLAWRVAVRVWCSAQVYGWPFAGWVPLRLIHANWINATSALAALATYLSARIRRVPLRWVKTEHEYPGRSALCEHKRTLEQILVGAAYVAAEQLEEARASKPAGVPLPAWLVRTGCLSERDLAAAISLRESLPLAHLAFSEIEPRVSRLLPARVIQGLRVLPFRVECGTVHIAATGAPGAEMHDTLRRFTGLEIRFHMITESEFTALAEQVL